MNKENKNDAPAITVEKTVNYNKAANLDESLKIQKTNNSNNSELFQNKKPDNSFTDNLLGKSSYQLIKGLILKPDLIIDENHYYFCPEKTKSDLEKEFLNDLNSYPYMFKPIKNDLVNYTKKKQTKEFKKKLGFFTSFFREIYFLFNKEELNKEIYNKAKKLAFLISQLNEVTKKSKKIVIFKANEAQFDLDNNYFDNSPIIQSINQDFNLDSKLINTIDDNYISILYAKMNELKKMIFNNCQNNNNDNEIIVFINYLIIKVNKILTDIVNSYESQSLKSETKNILKNMRNNINYLAIKYNFKKEYNKKFFYDIEFDVIKIIKDNENEREAFIENGRNLDQFILLFKEEKDFLDKKVIPVVDDDDNNENTKKDNNDFIKKCNSNIKKLIEMKNEKHENINDLKTNNINKGIDNIKNISVKIKNNNNNSENKDDNKDGKNSNNILNRSCTAIDIGGDIIKGINEYKSISDKISIKNLSIEGINEQINDWCKLKRIHQLLNDIDIKKKENKNFAGLLITQKIKKKDGIFIVSVIQLN